MIGLHTPFNPCFNPGSVVASTPTSHPLQPPSHTHPHTPYALCAPLGGARACPETVGGAGSAGRRLVPMPPFSESRGTDALTVSFSLPRKFRGAV